jgi:hypothetical protein
LHLRGHIGPLGGDEQAQNLSGSSKKLRAATSLLLFVSVEDRGDPLGVGGERLDAGALDLQ